MKLSHLIVGASDVKKSTDFYCELLGFTRADDDPGRVGGQVLLHQECELLVLPFTDANLPNPAHFACEEVFLNFYVADPAGSNVEVMVYPSRNG